jgi:hypothetical protein
MSARASAGRGRGRSTVRSVPALRDAKRSSSLRAGDVVEVRSEEEILLTLDKGGRLDALPFMPEMLAHCGKRFRVSGRAHKACDTIEWKQLRRMESAVHLEDLRCEGSAHGGCQAGCLLYWKEAWLKRIDDGDVDGGDLPGGAASLVDAAPACTREVLFGEATRPDATEGGEPVYSCQATQLLRATTRPLNWWEPDQYVEDVRSGNAKVSAVAHGLLVGFFNKFQQLNARLLPRFCLIRGCKPYPFVLGEAENGTPLEHLHLAPGEVVEVKSKDEIFATLDERDRNRGLRFDSEMLQYCGKRAKVLRRVEHIIDEQSGKMLHIKGDCIILEGVVCMGAYHRSCPRRIYPYWREIWLKRAE